MPKGQSLKERFFNKVNVDSNDKCWIWNGFKDSDGYGVIWTRERNNNERATHVSLRLHGTEVNKGDMVLHSCDNPSCVNPNHLSVGTNQENQFQARDRGLLGDLTAKRKKFIKSLSEQEFIKWTKKFEGKSGKQLGNLITATKWRME